MKNLSTIFGAPGTGKTTYLLNLLGELLKKYAPNEIAFVSFTRKGSYEGRDRAMKQFGFKEKDFPYFRTLHSIAFRELGMSKYQMISWKNYKDFSNAMGMNFLGYYTEDLINSDDKYLFYCALKRNNPEQANRMVDELDLRKVKAVEKNYQRFKDELGIFDFDDLIYNCIKQEVTLPVKVAIIDEAQDLTSMQWDLCKQLFKNCDKVYIAGDDDQAIYEWSGADVKQYLSLSSRSENKVILDKSYRLQSNILEFSKTITDRISGRVEKVFEPVSKGGSILFYNNIEEMSINSEESYYLLSRNNYFLNDYVKFLQRKGIVYTRKDKLSFDRAVVGAIKLYEDYRKGDPEKMFQDHGLMEYIKKDVKGFPPWFQAFNLDMSDLNYYRELFKNKADTSNINIQVNTIHGVKGGEADNVVVRMDMTRNVFNNLSKDIPSLNSELRCLYVAFTRAKKNLHIIYSNSKFGFDDYVRNY
jgi:superfamily I DNA/RNA helicase